MNMLIEVRVLRVIMRSRHALILSLIHICNAERHSLALLAQQLESLNPLQIMIKGFAKVEHDNKPITSVAQLQPNDDIRVTLADGYITARCV